MRFVLLALLVLMPGCTSAGVCQLVEARDYAHPPIVRFERFELERDSLRAGHREVARVMDALVPDGTPVPAWARVEWSRFLLPLTRDEGLPERVIVLRKNGDIAFAMLEREGRWTLV